MLLLIATLTAEKELFVLPRSMQPNTLENQIAFSHKLGMWIIQASREEEIVSIPGFFM